MNLLKLAPNIEVAYIGPSQTSGKLPAVFYFALSAQESLSLDPYNQPAVYLAEKGIRVFSLNLPAHGPTLRAVDAMNVWASAFAKGEDPIANFLDHVVFILHALIEKELILKENIGLMGLSRGGLIASLMARKCDIKTIVGFAPMTELTYIREFQQTQETQAEKYNLIHHAAFLCEKTIRFYIGNRDTRVGTRSCFVLVEALVEAAFEKGNRSPPIELIMSPSIGYMGHGTSKEIFEAGAEWLFTHIKAF